MKISNKKRGVAVVKLGIMQPYFFPYIGYWQLINAVDKYVVFDDVNYINRGWINRNRILCHGEPLYINIPLKKASQNKKINEIEVVRDPRHFRKLLTTLQNCYCKAPYFKEIFDFISSLLINDEPRLEQYLFNIIRNICGYLRIDTQLFLSSDIPKDSKLCAEAKIIDMCRLLGADQYYNTIGGQALYSKAHFHQEGIELYFLEAKPATYQQFQNSFVENLSIVDVMMFCSASEIREMLNAFTLL